MVRTCHHSLHAASVLVTWIIAFQIQECFCQVGTLTVDHSTAKYTTSANITARFENTLLKGSGYRLSWRFNEVAICAASIDPGPVLDRSSCDASVHAPGSKEFYYATNSNLSGQVVGANLTLNLLYQAAIFEDSPLSMDVYDRFIFTISNVINVTVQNCTGSSSGLRDATVSATCDFMCNATAQCLNSADEIEVTCQDDVTWFQPTNCSIVCRNPGEVPGIVITVFGGAFMILSVTFVILIAKGSPKGYEAHFWTAVGLLVFGFVLWLVGIILCFVSGDGSCDLTSSQKAGIALGVVGSACLGSSAGIAIYVYIKHGTNSVSPSPSSEMKNLRNETEK